MNNRFTANKFCRIRSLWYGVTLPYRSLRLILSHRSLIIWSLLPIVLTIVLYIFGIKALQGYAIGLLQDYLAKWGFDTAGFMGWSLLFLGKMFLWVFAALTFTFTSSIVASPFNDFLAEKTESYAYPPLPPVTNKSFKQQIKLIGIDLLKTVAAAFAAIFAVLFSWVPGLNIVAFVISFLLVTFQYSSYPQTRRGIGLKTGAKFLWEHIFACAGFGGVLTSLFSIPFLSSFVLPIAVVGGTLLVARAQRCSSISDLK